MIPVVPGRFAYQPRPGLEARLERTLGHLRTTRPDLSLDEEFRAFVPDHLPRAPTLHLDDQSAIGVRSVAYDWSHLQDRARVRAQSGDLVAASHDPPHGYETYCRDYLGLGRVAWLRPRQKKNRTHLAMHCWTDRSVRQELVRSIRSNGLAYLHPLMGGREVWELAHLLHHASHRPLKVIAPPPAVTAFVNDKVEFADVIRHLFGDRWIPETHSCSSLSKLSTLVRELAATSQVIGIKVPDAAGGRGNVVVPARDVIGQPLGVLLHRLRRLVRDAGWRGERHLLVGAWETDVLSAPSAQLWIPPGLEPPIVEGVFEQRVEGAVGEFKGSRPAELPDWVLEEIAERSWLVGRLFQHLGYVGRCSFDFVLIGAQVDRSRLEFIECNGRWGGTSLPMTLVNRLLPVTAAHEYIIRAVAMPRDRTRTFPDLVARLDDLLFDARTGRGHLVLFNPLRATLLGDLNVIAMAPTLDEARRLIEEELPDRLADRPPRRGHAIA